MHIFLGADHGGFAVKEALKDLLQGRGIELEDLGADVFRQDDDYPVYAQAVAERVGQDDEGRGIVLCRSGHGMVIAANKFPGVRAVLGTTPDSVRQAREHDNANVLAIGTDFTASENVSSLVAAFLDTAFLGGRHQRRLDQIRAIEDRT
jgi:ribose 5-phosphate isomerase B